MFFINSYAIGKRMIMKKLFILFLIPGLWFVVSCSRESAPKKWNINEYEYLETPGLSVLCFHNFYPVGKQGGIELIHHGERIATNGFLRLESGAGQRMPQPEKAERQIDHENNEITSTVYYQDLDFKYSVNIKTEGNGIRLSVDLERPIPSEWADKLNFTLEFYPPAFYGKSFHIGNDHGHIPIQANGPMITNETGNTSPQPLGQGKKLMLAGEDPVRKVIIESLNDELILVDERNFSGRGWLLVRSDIPSGVTSKAVEWFINPNLIPGWERDPMIALSQVGYHPDQEKKAIIELDRSTKNLLIANLFKVDPENGMTLVNSELPKKWGHFLCYDYAIFDFSSVRDPGIYVLQYGDKSSNPFRIDENIFKKDVWQPTLEAYFPIQMCHLEVRDRAAIWHGACHLDDALQAPLATEHVDGYRQYENAETDFLPMHTVPMLNQGGWHDAGDDDLAAGSQAATTHYLALSNEISNVFPDQTSVDYENKMVIMRRPDGIPDMVQQVKHGAINLLSGYRVAGHSFAGIIANREGRNKTGDWASQTDQLFYDSRLDKNQKTLTHSGKPDDRWVFTNRDTGLEYKVIAALASSSRILKGYDDELAKECLETAIKAYSFEQANDPLIQPNAYVPRNTELEEVLATVELFYTTNDQEYLNRLISMLPQIKKNIGRAAWGIARIKDHIKDEKFNSEFLKALKDYKVQLDSSLNTNPFKVPWDPAIWGVGWKIQQFALEHYFLVEEYPDLFDPELVFRVVNYVLGCHPGSNISLVSGVGAHSVTVAFGVYRDWRNYITGGMVSGTSFIRPDFPELKEDTPYLWQQSEYVMPGAGSYIFCVLAADRLLNN
jgi:hypothetical protein